MKSKAVLLLISMLALSIAADGESSTQSYALRDGYDTGPGPIGMAFFLLEGDNSQEIITLNEGSDENPAASISILRNDGNGTYPTRLDMGLETKSSDFVVSDFNGDSLPDVAVASGRVIGFGNVTIFLNNGAGLEQAGTVDIGRSPAGLAYEDFDKDGDFDIVAANYRDDSLTVLFNNGVGNFTKRVEYPVFSHPTFVASADVNGDGVADLLATSDGWETGTYRINILLNFGNGTFSQGLNYTTGKSPVKLLSIDLNGDGLPEIVTLCEGSGEVRIRLNLGNGEFSAADIHTFDGGVRDIFAADMDSDENPDILALTGGLSREVEALKNKGNGTYERVHLFYASKGTERLMALIPSAGAALEIITLDRANARLEVHSAIEALVDEGPKLELHEVLDRVFGSIIPLNNPYVAISLALISSFGAGATILAGRGRVRKRDGGSRHDDGKGGNTVRAGLELTGVPETPGKNGAHKNIPDLVTSPKGANLENAQAKPTTPISHDAFRPPPGLGSTPKRKVKGGDIKENYLK